MIQNSILRRLCIPLALAVALPCFAQTAAQPAGPAVPVRSPGSPLNIIVLEGKNAINSLSSLRSVAPIVEVRDSNDFPIEGAQVVFTLPDHGPGGTFAQGGSSFTARTDASGQATAPFIIPSQAGRFQIHVTAAIGGRTGETYIQQTNSNGAFSGTETPAKPWYKRKKILLIAGGAAAGAVILIVLLSGGSSASTATVAVTPGAPVFH